MATLAIFIISSMKAGVLTLEYSTMNTLHFDLRYPVSHPEVREVIYETWK